MFKRKVWYEYKIIFRYVSNGGEEGKGVNITQRESKIKTMEDIEGIAEDILRINSNELEWVEVESFKLLRKIKGGKDKQ